MSDSDLTAHRVAQNQSTFRAVNEEIEAAAQEIGVDLPRIPFICECPDTTCTQTTRLSLPEYEEVRADSRRFWVAPGHEVCRVGDEEVAQILSHRDGYTLMEKINEAGEAAARMDGRS